ncbi:MAG TPA: shikimate dehydrogenase [Sphingobacteriaceae bacterium]|nr:shikimate dehydrogenase [Sphingobacteriaceae bacterium]
MGDPVSHSGSPAMHNAAFRAVGRDACYLAFGVPDKDVPTVVRGFQAAGVVGLNVTVPHKEQALALADRATDRARAVGAANVLAFREDGILADNTDGEGFLRALGAAGVDLAQKTVLMLGAGGAARAVAAACATGGAGRLVVANRSLARGEALLAQVPLGATAGILCPLDSVQEWLPHAQAIIQATSLGLKDDDPLPLPLELWPEIEPGTVVMDLLYKRGGTPFVHQAAAQGLTALDGRSMLVWQAALSWEVWFGEMGPVQVMAEALDRWLDGDDGGDAGPSGEVGQAGHGGGAGREK